MNRANDTNIILIVQARMGSSRLPNKSMLHLHGFPIIEWVYRRVKKAKLVDNVVVAIPNTDKDNSLAYFLEEQGANVFRGSENDLVERYVEAAIKWEASHVVRVCADNPLVCGSEIDCLIEFYNAKQCDLAYNNIPKNNLYPRGIGGEILAFETLQAVHRKARKSYDREHVTTYIHSDPEQFGLGTFDPQDERLMHPEIKLDIDSYQDYEKLLRMKVDIDMEAHEIVTAAISLEDV